MEMLDVMQRALEGEPMSENDYQLRRFAPKVQEKVKEYKIKFDPKNPIPDDASLADDLFGAAIELLADVGAYCTSTSRVISYTEREIREALRSAPEELIMGEGRDRRILRGRKTGDRNPPWCLLGAAGAGCSSDESFITLVEGYAEIPETNAITTPALTRVGGMRIRPASPLEVFGAMRNAVLAREACNRVGREGIPIMNSLATAESDIAFAAALHPKFGMRRSDGYMICCMDPMKTDFARLNKVTTAHSLGGPVGMCEGPLLGGYAGGPEGTTLSSVAHHMMGVLTYQASWTLPFPLHLRYTSSSCREMLWVVSTTGQAISRNSHLISTNINFTSAGPATSMCLFETSATVLAAVTAGLSIESVGVASNRYEDRMTPVEPRISAEMGHAIASMKLSDANEIAKKLLAKYESKLSNPPLGKDLHECWNAEKRRPTKEYQSLIRSYKKSMKGLGVELKEEI